MGKVVTYLLYAQLTAIINPISRTIWLCHEFDISLGLTITVGVNTAKYFLGFLFFLVALQRAERVGKKVGRENPGCRIAQRA